MPSWKLILTDEVDIRPDYGMGTLHLRLFASGKNPNQDAPDVVVKLRYPSDIGTELLHMETGRGRVLRGRKSREKVLAILESTVLAPGAALRVVLEAITAAGISAAYAGPIFLSWNDESAVLGEWLSELPDEYLEEAGKAIAVGYRALYRRGDA